MSLIPCAMHACACHIGAMPLVDSRRCACMQLASELDYDQAVEELKQSADWLRSQGAPKVPARLPSGLFTAAAFWTSGLCGDLRCDYLSEFDKMALQVGVIGFCMGGSLSLLAAEYAKVDCAVSFYGVPRSYPSHVSARPVSLVLLCAAARHVLGSCFHSMSMDQC